MDDYLREVDWESLEGPYGPASDVPRLLQALRSQDPAARVEAERQLEDRHLEHQGLVREPSAAAAPYLIDLLADTHAPDRLVACRLLQLPGVTVSQAAARTGFSDAASFGRAFKREAQRSPGQYRRLRGLPG